MMYDFLTSSYFLLLTSAFITTSVS